MKRARAILLSMMAMSLCLAGPAIARNTQGIVEATTAPPRGGFALLAGDITGQQVYIVFSATVGGDGRIVLPVFLDGQSSNINVTLGSEAVVSIDHTVTVTGTVSLGVGIAEIGKLAAGAATIGTVLIQTDGTLTAVGQLQQTAARSFGAGLPMLAERDDVLSTDEANNSTFAWLKTNDRGALWIEIDTGIASIGTVGLDAGQSLSIDHTVTVTGSVALNPGQSLSIDHSLTVTGSVALDAGQSVSIDHSLTVTGRLTTDLASGATIDHQAVTVGNTATLILASSATRRTITIINAFTDLLAIGNSDVTLNTAASTDGFVLGASGAANDGTGGALTLTTTSAVFGIGASASSKVMVVTESN